MKIILLDLPSEKVFFLEKQSRGMAMMRGGRKNARVVALKDNKPKYKQINPKKILKDIFSEKNTVR